MFLPTNTNSDPTWTVVMASEDMATSPEGEFPKGTTQDSTKGAGGRTEGPADLASQGPVKPSNLLPQRIKGITPGAGGNDLEAARRGAQRERCHASQAGRGSDASPSPEPWVDTCGAGTHLDVSPRTVRRLHSGGMPGCRVGGQLRFRLSEIDDYFRSGGGR